ITLTMYVGPARVVTAYEPSNPVGRQMRPLVNGVSTQTRTSGTASPLSLRTRPFICGQPGSVMSSVASDERSKGSASTPPSPLVYQRPTARTRSGGSAHTQYSPGTRSAEYAPCLSVSSHCQPMGAASVL